MSLPPALLMTRRRSRTDPNAIARWRYEQITEALAADRRDVRGGLVRELERHAVRWPSGDVRPVSRASAYRWIDLFEKGALKALRPAPRKDKGKKRARLPCDVMRAAMKLLADDPGISLSFLLPLLEADPKLRLKQRGIRVARSTLHRRLRADPLFRQLKRTEKLNRRRTRFVAEHPHDSWHLDAKGPVQVRLISKSVLTFHVLTVLDDASRAVLAVLIVLTPNLSAAVRVIRRALKRWGLPLKIYVDRASIFDSPAFRAGLAACGVRRIWVRSRNPEVNGKIEAYHRVLIAWFTGRLDNQRVVDLEHLQQLLDAVIETVYQDHRHRSLKTSPRKALADQISTRQLAASRLDEAFRQEVVTKAHRKTGEVDFGGITYLVPQGVPLGERITFLVDPDPALLPLVIQPGTDRHLPLTRAQVRPEDRAEAPGAERWGEGPLQTLYDAWQGKVRPNAEPGFGLPELFLLLAEVVGRPVPRSDSEAAAIQRAWRQIGPLAKKPTQAALRAIGRQLGVGRPMSAYLDALRSRVVPHSTPHPRRRSRP